MMVDVTKHAYKRAKDRLGWNSNAIDRMADKALDEGVTHGETSGRLHRYITKLWFSHKYCNNARIYGENIFFFTDNKLITLYRLPNNLIKTVKWTDKKDR